MKRFAASRHAVGLIGLAAVIALSAAIGSAHTAAAARMSPAIGNVRPELSAPQTPLAGTTDTFDCQSETLDSQSRCYSPQQIQQAYGFSSLLSRGVNGAGKTIVIVDAFYSPYVQQDLSIEDSTFGLPDPPSFTVVNHAGPFDITNDDEINWAAETSLDVISAHAMAPGAKIVLVEAASDSDADLYAAEKYAVDNKLGDVMSQSFGNNEACVDPAYFKPWRDLIQKASDQGWTFVASTGDAGAAQFTCDGSDLTLATGWPAVDPNVTAVGGTTLNADDPAGNYLGETAWTDPAYGCFDPFDSDCSGGGFSTIFKRPGWQNPAIKPAPPSPGKPPAPPGPPMRGIPDVSYDAGVNGGILIHVGVINDLFGYDPVDPTVFFPVGGTSAGPPQWAALVAEADQLAKKDLGSINDNLYKLAGKPASYASDFNDVTTGDNDVVVIGGLGYSAAIGWDPVTGLGSPQAQNLVPALAGSPPPPPPKGH